MENFAVFYFNQNKHTFGRDVSYVIDAATCYIGVMLKIWEGEDSLVGDAIKEGLIKRRCLEGCVNE